MADYRAGAWLQYCDLKETYIFGHSDHQNRFFIYVWSSSRAPQALGISLVASAMEASFLIIFGLLSSTSNN